MSRRSKRRRSNWRLMLALLAAGTLVGLIAQARSEQSRPLSGRLPTLSITVVDRNELD